MRMSASRTPTPLAATDWDEYNPSLSSNGRFVAYQSNDTGRDEIYVRDATGAGGIFHVFRQQQARRGPTGPPRLVAPPVADHENESWLEGALKSPAGAV